MGCGEGRSTHSLAGIFERADVVGFDLDHDSIVFAQSNNSNPRVTFIGMFINLDSISISLIPN